MPALAAEDFYVLQLVKNISTGDDPSGEKYTMANPGDELRHLVVVRNTSDTPRELAVAITLPRFLNLENGSTEKLAGASGWSMTDDADTPLALTLAGKESFVFRFTTNVDENFPNENSVLTTLASATTAEDSAADTTKIYVANFIETAALPEKFGELSDEERESVEKEFSEEKEIIQKKFSENSETETQQTETEIETEEAKTETNFVFWLLLIVAATILLISLKNVRKKN